MSVVVSETVEFDAYGTLAQGVGRPMQPEQVSVVVYDDGDALRTVRTGLLTGIVSSTVEFKEKPVVDKKVIDAEEDA